MDGKYLGGVGTKGLVSEYLGGPMGIGVPISLDVWNFILFFIALQNII